ncbi:MAG: GAF domain-containing protein [Thermoleophilia bacterium]
MNRSERHLRLVTETIAAVNSTLDLQEILELVATKVAAALESDACFVYLYDDAADELVLRATVGTTPERLTRRPRLRRGEGITGAAAAAGAPIAIESDAHLDPRFKHFPNLHEQQYQSILAVPILAKEVLEGALNVRTVAPRAYSDDEIDLLMVIAGQVAQAIEHAKLYEHAQRRVAELEALARISETVSESLYLEETLAEIVSTSMGALQANRAAIVLADGSEWSAGEPGGHVERSPLRWKGREIGELVCERAVPFSDEERTLLTSIAHHAAVAVEQGRSVMRGVLARRSTTASRTTCRRSPRCCGCRPARRRPTRARCSRTRSTGSSRSPPCTRC